MKSPCSSRALGGEASGGFENANHRTQSISTWSSPIAVLLFAFVGVFPAATAAAQSSLPFEVSNARHVKWPAEEARRIYAMGCELVARSIRPEHPPKLHPSFVLVLGANADETVRNGRISEVHLRSWDAPRFSEAVVIMATREILKADDLRNLAQNALMAAEASVTVEELREK